MRNSTETFKISSKTLTQQWLLEKLFTELYLEPCQTSMNESFAETVNYFPPRKTPS